MIKSFRKIGQNLLSEGKTGKYLKYAIGEIVLVVIGILIALQITNWNESRKNNIKLNNYRSTLIVELKKDYDEIQIFLQGVKDERQKFDSQKARILNSLHPIDTVIQIARYDFSPFIPKLSHLNNNTFLMLQSTGDLELFNIEVVEQLFNLYKEEGEILKDMETPWSNYTRVVNDYNKTFLLNVNMSLMDTGRINEILWENIDKLSLTYHFNSISLAKQNYLRVCLFSERLLKPLEDLIAKLESQDPINN